MSITKSSALTIGLLAVVRTCWTQPAPQTVKLARWRMLIQQGAALASVSRPAAMVVPTRFAERHSPWLRQSKYCGRDVSSVVPAASGADRIPCDPGRSRAAQWVSVRRQANLEGCAMSAEPPPGGFPPPEHLHGVFAVYKPKGWSSSDVVSKIKGVLTKGAREEVRAKQASSAVGAERSEVQTSIADTHKEDATGGGGSADAGGEGKDKRKKKGAKRGPQRRQGPKVKVGHGGTLDPMATGVLVIGVGRGCRELGGYLEGGKMYRVEALLGHETNTQDAEGEATLRGEWEHVTEAAVDAALGDFTGHIMQVPPMFSALHKDGKRLYELARKGITVEREPRPVIVHSLLQVKPALPLPRLGLNVASGGGFYVRALVEDLGRALETRAHMTALERIKQGPFELDHALRREDWEYETLLRHLEDTRTRMSHGDDQTSPAQDLLAAPKLSAAEL